MGAVGIDVLTRLDAPHQEAEHGSLREGVREVLASQLRAVSPGFVRKSLANESRADFSGVGYPWP